MSIDAKYSFSDETNEPYLENLIDSTKRCVLVDIATLMESMFQQYKEGELSADAYARTLTRIYKVLAHAGK